MKEISVGRRNKQNKKIQLTNDRSPAPANEKQIHVVGAKRGKVRYQLVLVLHHSDRLSKFFLFIFGSGRVHEFSWYKCACRIYSKTPLPLPLRVNWSISNRVLSASN